ncbi:MAG: response regulator [Thermodesulfobacteriota bacterium]|nr:response regulator [Thermodesulfobacteriota bacterium]
MNRILVAESEESIQRVYADELTQEGYDVITSNDGSQLMELIAQKKPDLIVLDPWLGKHSGLDLYQNIQNAYRNLPIILCTLYRSFKYDPEYVAYGFHVVRSSDLSDLKLKVKMAIEVSSRVPHQNDA